MEQLWGNDIDSLICIQTVQFTSMFRETPQNFKIPELSYLLSNFAETFTVLFVSY